MVAKVDFTKLSQHMLERAAANSKISREVIMMAAVTVCLALRSQIAVTSQALTKETKKSKKFIPALATANRDIEELQKKIETLQSRLQTEKDDNGLEQINGSWTPKLHPYTQHVYAPCQSERQEIKITCRKKKICENRFIDLSIERVLSKSFYSTNPRVSAASYHAQSDKFYCVRISGCQKCL